MRFPRWFFRGREAPIPGVTLLGFDLETTGIDPRVDLPVSYALVESNNPSKPASMEGISFHESGLINPGIPIPERATEIHGITDAQAAKGMGLLEAVERIGAVLVSTSQKGIPLVGMNLAYDLTMIDTIWARLTGKGLVEHGWLQTPVIDVLVIDRHIDKYRKGGHNLGVLCKVYGVEHRGAHDASNDVIACLDVARKILTKPQLAQLSHDELTRRQINWRGEWARHYSQWRMENDKDALPEDEADWPVRRRLLLGEVVPTFAFIPREGSVAVQVEGISRFADPNLTKAEVDQLRVEAKDNANPDSPIFGKQVHFTGTFTIPKAEAQTHVMRAGGEVAGPLTKETAFLVAGYQNPALLQPGASHSKKYLLAQQLQSEGSSIQIIDEAALIALLAIPTLPPPTEVVEIEIQREAREL